MAVIGNTLNSIVALGHRTRCSAIFNELYECCLVTFQDFVKVARYLRWDTLRATRKSVTRTSMVSTFTY